MSQRTLPLKSSRYRAGEAWATLLIAIASGWGARWFLGPGVLTLAPMMIALLLVSPVSDWLAKKWGAELVTFAERYRRSMEQWAELSLFDVALRYALIIGCTAVVTVVTIMPIDEWPVAGPVAAGMGLVLGALCGSYIWISAKRIVRSYGSGEAAPQPIKFGERAARHYAGYAIALAAALSAAAGIEDRQPAAIAALVAFLVGKFAADYVLAKPYVPARQPSFGIVQFIRAPFFGAIWWGVPWGALLALLTHVLAPAAELGDVVMSFVIALVGAAFLMLWMVIWFILSHPRTSATQD